MVYSILVDRVIEHHRAVEQGAIFAQVMGRRLLEEPPTLDERLAMLASAVGYVRRRSENLTPDEVALRRALGLRGY